METARGEAARATAVTESPGRTAAPAKQVNALPRENGAIFTFLFVIKETPHVGQGRTGWKRDSLHPQRAQTAQWRQWQKSPECGFL